MSTDRAGSPPSSEAGAAGPGGGGLRFLEQEGRELDAPREWEPALVEVLVAPTRWEQVRLRFQGGELPLYLRRLGGELRVLADWPRSGAGHYRLQLLRDVESAAENFVVTVRPRKLSGEQFEQLLADLETLPAAVALSLQRMGALSGVKLLPPSETTLAAEAARLRRAVLGHAGRPGLLTVMTRMAADPRRVLRHVHEWVPRERTRRPSPALLAASVTLRHNVGQDGLPMRVMDARVEHTVDVYENRLVKTFYEQVRIRLRRLLPALLAAKQSAAWSEMQGLEENLRRAHRQAVFLDNVRRLSHLPLRLTMVLLKRPLYRAAFEELIELHCNAWAVLDSPALDSPLENLPTLYQHWGTLQVYHAALEVAADLGYEIKQQTLVGREPGGVFVRTLPDGLTTIMLEHPRHRTRAEPVIERSYARAGGLRSVSYSQRPDVTLEVHPQTGTPRIYLFDPKYKLIAEEADVGRSDGKPATELVSTLIIAGMALLYAAVQVNIAGRIFAVLLNGPVVLGVVLTVVIVGGYLVIGGYATSIRTGVFQWFVIMVIVLLPWMVTSGAWSVPPVSTIASPGVTMGIAFAGISLLVTVCSTDLWQLIFSSRSESDSRLGFYVSVPIYIVISIGMVLFATAVHAAVGVETKPENAFFNLFSLASVPPIAVATVGVFVAASIMSTLDSQVFLFCSTIIGLKSKAPTDDPATARPLRVSIIVVMVLLGLIAITITDLVEFLFGTVTLATILTPVLIISAMKSRTGVSDRGTAGALLVTSAIYIALFVLGAFENLIMTLIPAGVATLFVIVLLAVARQRID